MTNIRKRRKLARLRVTYFRNSTRVYVSYWLQWSFRDDVIQSVCDDVSFAGCRGGSDGRSLRFLIVSQANDEGEFNVLELNYLECLSEIGMVSIIIERIECFVE